MAFQRAERRVGYSRLTLGSGVASSGSHVTDREILAAALEDPTILSPKPGDKVAYRVRRKEWVLAKGYVISSNGNGNGHEAKLFPGRQDTSVYVHPVTIFDEHDELHHGKKQRMVLESSLR